MIEKKLLKQKIIIKTEKLFKQEKQKNSFIKTEIPKTEKLIFHYQLDQ